jgi:hypothetical protein
MQQKPPYKPIKQEPYCCVPACVSMVLDRRGISHGSQGEIGHELGLMVPKEKAHLFPGARIAKRASDYGTHVGKKRYSINSFFSKHRIRLRESYYPTSKIRELGVFIAENLKKGNDVIACFNNRKLYGTGHYGHVSLIQAINRGVVTLVDPAKGIPGKRKVKLSKLKDAMEYHRKSRGGLWVISGA